MRGPCQPLQRHCARFELILLSCFEPHVCTNPHLCCRISSPSPSPALWCNWEVPWPSCRVLGTLLRLSNLPDSQPDTTPSQSLARHLVWLCLRACVFLQIPPRAIDPTLPVKWKSFLQLLVQTLNWSQGELGYHWFRFPMRLERSMPNVSYSNKVIYFKD